MKEQNTRWRGSRGMRFTKSQAAGKTRLSTHTYTPPGTNCHHQPTSTTHSPSTQTPSRAAGWAAHQQHLDPCVHVHAAHIHRHTGECPHTWLKQTGSHPPTAFLPLNRLTAPANSLSYRPTQPHPSTYLTWSTLPLPSVITQCRRSSITILLPSLLMFTLYAKKNWPSSGRDCAAT